MKISTSRKSARKGFTLIEMIGVLAVIAILASLLIPKIYEAINNARINNAVVSYNTVKTGLADHYAKYGSLNSSNGTTVSVAAALTNYDKILLSEGFLDKPFQVKVSPAAWISAVTGSGFDANTALTTDGAYDLDGDGKNDVIGAAYVVEAVIPAVAESDARAISDRLDGATLSIASTAAGNTADTKGRVKYATISGGVADVYIYITHR